PPCTPRPGAPSSPRGRVSRASTWWRRPGRSRTIRTSPTSDSPATRRAPPGRWDRCGWCGSGRTGLGTARSPSGRCGRASRRCGSRGTAGASTDPPAVRTVRPERPDSGWIQWISEIEPDPRRDLRVLMALRHLSVQLWSDPVDLAPVLQLTIEEARRAVQQLLDHHLRGRPLIHEIEGVPSAAPMPSVAVDGAALEALATLRRGAGAVDRRPSREQVALSYARSRGRISTTELGSIVGAAPTNLGRVLRNLEHDGAIEPSRPNRRGPGFCYRYVADDD